MRCTPWKSNTYKKSPVHNLLKDIFVTSITRTIHKDNVIRFNGNRYSVPLGTYRQGSSNIAYIEEDGEHLLIRLQENGHLLAKHKIASGRGMVISDPTHRERSHTKRDHLIQQIEALLEDKEVARWLIEVLSERYPRHLIDQLKVVQSVILKHPSSIEKAIHEMRRLQLTSANDLRDIAISLEIQEGKNRGPIHEKYKELIAPERRENIYVSVLQGGKTR